MQCFLFLLYYAHHPHFTSLLILLLLSVSTLLLSAFLLPSTKLATSLFCLSSASTSHSSNRALSFSFKPKLCYPTQLGLLPTVGDCVRPTKIRHAASMKENGSSRKQGAPSPCAACKLLRRRCAQDCVFAPYFPADEPQKFANVHKVFGASNVNKMLQELPEQQRGDAVSSMVYEANARVRDPVYGCVGAISSLQQQIDVLQTQLALAQAEVVHLKVRQTASFSNHGLSPASPSNSGSPPSKFMGSQARPIFDMDMMVDHTSLGLGESMWSC